jgi:hypothetical protein
MMMMTMMMMMIIIIIIIIIQLAYLQFTNQLIHQFQSIFSSKFVNAKQGYRSRLIFMIDFLFDWCVIDRMEVISDTQLIWGLRRNFHEVARA